MIYPDGFEKKIGFDAIREAVRKECTSPLGESALESELVFESDFNLVALRLRRVEEMRLILLQPNSQFSLGTIHDLRTEIQHIRIPGTWLAEDSLLKLRDNLSTISGIINFFKSGLDESETELYPYLGEVIKGLREFPEIETLIEKTVDRFGQVRDNASPQLSQIRHDMRAAGGAISSAMRRVISKGIQDGVLEADTQPSIRDGRLVIPVSPQHKRKIRGITHDESASGKTIFIEPEAVVEANNRLRELSIEERHEITRILIGVADVIRPYIEPLSIETLPTLGHIDFIHAKARYAINSDGTLPYLSPEPELEWYGACHPGLKLSLSRQNKPIVPLDIFLKAPDRRILVISGPNAGGKSVTLKTVATIQYMAQCGLLPTLFDNSHVGIFDSILLDIGDDQSIEDDLSTYSSHLRNMKTFLAKGDSHSLVLIDEFGSGTEPQIGAAIAQALLDAFNRKEMWGIVTTHFQNLKKFAEETPGLVNGSMLYDRHLMLPTFRLAIGHPGSSFALEIARKTGLPEEILDNAREIVGSDYVNLDKYLLDIARDRRYWENKRHDIRLKEKRIDEILERYGEDADSLRQQRRAILAEAREEAQRIIEGSNAAIERTIREIRQAQAQKEITAEARRRLKEEAVQLSSSDAIKDPEIIRKAGKRTGNKSTAKSRDLSKVDEPIKPGDNVILDKSTTVGTVDSISGSNAIVVFGSMKTTVKINRLTKTIRKPSTSSLRRPGEKPGTSNASTSEASRQRHLNFHPEIDVRGMRVDEAVQAVMYFIDDAIQFGSQRVRILHGTGTGALRQYIRSYLQGVDLVKSFHDEDIRLGGAGITVVELE